MNKVSYLWKSIKLKFLGKSFNIVKKSLLFRKNTYSNIQKLKNKCILLFDICILIVSLKELKYNNNI